MPGASGATSSRRRPESSDCEDTIDAVDAERILAQIREVANAKNLRTKDVLAEFDDNGDGELECKEMTKALRKFAPDLTRKQAKEVFDFLDQEGTGIISVKQLDRALKAAHKACCSSASSVHSMKSAKRSTPQRTPRPHESRWGRLGPPPDKVLTQAALARNAASAAGPRSRDGSPMSGSSASPYGPGGGWANVPSGSHASQLSSPATTTFTLGPGPNAAKTSAPTSPTSPQRRGRAVNQRPSQGASQSSPVSPMATRGSPSNAGQRSPASASTQARKSTGMTRSYSLSTAEKVERFKSSFRDHPAPAPSPPRQAYVNKQYTWAQKPRPQAPVRTEPQPEYRPQRSSVSQKKLAAADMRHEEVEREEIPLAPELLELRRVLRTRWRSRRSCFAALDVNQSGGITYSELCFTMDALHIPWMDIFVGQTLKDVFRNTDVDRNGTLGPDELLGPAYEWELGDETDEEDDSYKRRVHIAQHMSESKELNDKINAIQFADWASDCNRWRAFQDLFTEEHHLTGMATTRYVKKDEFVKFCTQHGFQGSSEAIFQEVRRECRSDKDDLHRKMNVGNDDVVTLRQFQYFRWRLSGHMATLPAGQWGSPVNALVNTLRARFGSGFRGWRLEVDKRQAGRVGKVDFLAAMRRLGMAAQVKQTWDTLRPDGSTQPVEFKEVDPQESAILTNFVEFATLLYGKDVETALDNVFLFLDKNHQNFVNFDGFFRGLKELGYRGNAEHARVLFCGLDHQGIGRITKADMQSLNHGSSRTNAALQRDSGGYLRDFKLWVQRELGGVDILIEHLGLAKHPDDVVPPGVQGPKAHVPLKFMQKTIESLGYPGDGADFCTKMSRRQGLPSRDAAVSAKLLYDLLARDDSRNRTALKRSKSLDPRQASLQSPCSRIWQDSMLNVSNLNDSLPAHQRTYFSSPRRDDDPINFDFTPARRSTDSTAFRDSTAPSSSRPTSSAPSPGRSSPGRRSRTRTIASPMVG